MSVIASEQVRGSTGSTYEVRLFANRSAACTCPSWKFQSVPPLTRRCKHTDWLSTVALAASA